MGHFSGWGEKTRTLLNKSGKGLSGGVKKLPPLNQLFRILSLLRWPAFFVAGVLCAGVLIDSLILYVFDKDEKKKRKPPQAVIPTQQKELYLEARNNYQIIPQKNIFCPGCKIPDLEKRKVERPQNCDDAEEIRGVTLIGTIVLSDPRFSVATLSSGSSPSVTVKVGEDFARKGKVFEIRQNRVCFTAPDGGITFVELPETKSLVLQPTRNTPKKTAPKTVRRVKVDGIDAKSDSEFVLDRSFLLKSLQDPNILQQAHASPYRVNGEIQGFRINSVDRGSVFEALGIQAQDVISEVDGSPMDSLARAQELYSAAASTDEINITVIRGGSPVTLNYKVK